MLKAKKLSLHRETLTQLTAADWVRGGASQGGVICRSDGWLVVTGECYTVPVVTTFC